jgi:hypothetical protein
MDRSEKLYLPLHDLAQQGQTGLHLLRRVGGLDGGGDDGDVLSRGGDTVRETDHADVDVVLALDLLGGDDDLNGLGVVGAGDGVVEDADGAHHAADGAALAAAEVGRVADDDVGGGHLYAHIPSRRHEHTNKIKQNKIK